MSDEAGRRCRPPRVTFNAAGYIVEDAYELGTAREQITAFERDDATAKMTAVTVSCGGTAASYTLTEHIGSREDANHTTARLRLPCDRAVLARHR